MLASQLGWAVEGSAQLEYAEWPGGILAEARVQVRKEKIRGIEQVEALCIEIQRNIESLGEEGAYSNEGFQLRRQYLQWLKVLKEKWKEIEDIQKEKAAYFLSLTVEAEINNIQSKRLYDLGLFDEARLFANRATDKRDDAFYCARVLGWFQDALLQLEYKRWSAILLEKAISAHKNQSM
ncbi:MAG TPA: hypothetical protein DIU37_06645 [Opitutae bacterium]|nr:hypothetical protein [Opitutae bacterium]